MANTSADQSLAQLLGEPPRKRRAAALAAQKNWQMLNKPEDDLLTEEDIIIISEKESFAKPIENKTLNNITVVPQKQYKIMPSIKRTSVPNTIVIDLMSNKTKRNNIIDTDLDYVPIQEVRHGMRAKKTITTPSRSVYLNNSKTPQNMTQNKSLLKGQELIHIESEQSNRVIVRTNGSQYKKPVVNKLHPNEPLILPIFEDEVEEIVGTYEVEEEVCNRRQSDDPINDLDMNVFSDSDDKPLDETSDNNQSSDSIEVIEVIEENDNKEVETKSNKTVIPPKIPNTYSRKNKPIKGHLDSVIETLEMECENFDDDFTDCLCFDGEEDILNANQWNKSMASKREYTEYSKAVVSTKNVKFLSEAEVTEPIGVITTTVSETTRIVTIPTRTPVTLRTRQQSLRMSQSVRTPIPSTANRINILSPQRPQNMMPSMAPMAQMPVQNMPLNGMPITLVPVSTSAGISSPLILAPTTPSIITPGGLPPGVRVILSSGGPNHTYLMLPRSNANTIPAPNIYLSNQNTIYQQNFITPNANQIIRASNPIPPQPRYRAAPPLNTNLAIRSATRGPTAMRQPIINNYSNVTNRFPNNQSVLMSENTSVVNNQTNITPRSDPLFDCLTVLKGTQNSTKKINMRNVLTIKPLPFSWPSNIDELISSLIKLDNALMKEKFKESPIAWMVSSQLITPPKCRVCQKGVCNQVNKAQNTKNEYWQCNNQRCNTSYPIDRPRIFSGPQFDLPVSKLLFVIYYWSIQVDVEDLIKTGQIELGTEKIFNIWQKLQKVCSNALQTKDSKLGSGHRDVEIASIQVGRFHVLGAMEVVTHRTKLCVVPISSIVQQNGKQLVLQPFIQWLEKGTTVKTTELKFTALRDYGFKVSIQSKNDFLATNKNLSLNTIGGYLIHHLQRFFKEFDLSSLTLDILSNILEELLWRERYGTNPFSAFYNIIKHISEQCGLRPVEQNTNVQIATQIQTRTLNSSQTPPFRAVSRTPTLVLNDTNSIFVDEYYYSSLKLKTDFTKNSLEEDSAKDRIQCHLCQMFFDNILLIKHLLEHLEKERGGRVRKGDNNESECKHCLRFFSNRTLHMHDELANLRLIPYSCRICALPFYARHPFIQHMKTSHFSGEMPYYCDICSFRSSFQKNLLDHFEASHSSTSQVMCPFCIRIFDLSKYKNLSQFVYRHLATHYAVASVYDCEKCVLTFTTKFDLKEHSFKGHNPSITIDEKFEIMPFVVQEDDKQLCVRAQEPELFTPNLPTFGSNSFVAENSANNKGMASEDNELTCELSCEPNIADFLSIEPECQLSLTEANSSLANFIFPVDCDYSNEQLKQMLSKSFEMNLKSEESEEGIEKQNDLILSNDQTIVCFECKTCLTIDHFISKSVCEKCNFTTHCKTILAEHKSGAHSSTAPELYKQSSVLKAFPQLISYNIVCNDCEFQTQDGNQMALHMITTNHFNPLCKPLTT